MTTFLKAFGIKGYRSFGSQTQYLYPLNKINLFAGQNNSGKSNILSFIHELASPKGKSRGVDQDHLNKHLGNSSVVMELSLVLDLSANNIDNQISALCNEDLLSNQGFTRSLRRLLDGIRNGLGQDELWFSYSASDLETLFPRQELFIENGNLKIGDAADWQRVWSIVNGSTGGGPRHWVTPVLDFINPIRRLSLPKSYTIPALREIGAKETVFEGFDGAGIIQRLSELERPNIQNYHLKEDFENINTFLKEVTENPTARLEIPADKSTILVEMNGRTLPISSLGTGIHEVIILATAATSIHESIICLEEPELHLHPKLQKRLINYLADNTDNQYFISTHSAHLLDSNGSSVFHVSLESGASKVTFALSPADRANISRDLGYRPSDLMQTNAIIWVEGPSDRVYINKWLSQLDPDLIEGIDYSIMFYGGRLLSHLSADDPSVSDFISLRRLNRHISILIDSDRSSSHKPINATKKRVREEFNAGPGFAWVTSGREIENYIEPKLLAEAIAAIHPKFRELISEDKFACVYHYKDSRDQLHTDIDKVAVARYLAEKELSLERYDLKHNLDNLINFIKNANKH